MSEKKKPAEGDIPPKKTELAITKKKPVVVRKLKKKTTTLARNAPQDLYQAFEDTFDRFRNDFEDLLFPSTWPNTFSPVPDTRVPTMDLEDGEKEYRLKVEMPGFKKEDIEIELQENAVVITGEVGWKYDKKEREYICKERACKSFYRTVDLPEEIDVNAVTANLRDGVLEVCLPKKTPKQKRKMKLT